MLYIITEDSNSAREFWKCVARTFKGEGRYTMVIPSKGVSGNTTLSNQVMTLFPSLKSGDELFVAFDSILGNKSFDPSKFLINTAGICASKNVQFKFTSYYCFEELYLSYTELLNISRLEGYDNITLEALKQVQAKVNSGIDYFIKSDPIINSFIAKHKKDTGKNREHFANQLLVVVTQSIEGHFVITKKGNCFSDKGECWLKDCKEIQSKLVPQHRDNLCSACKYCCKLMGMKDKLIDLESKSLSKISTYKLSQI